MPLSACGCSSSRHISWGISLDFDGTCASRSIHKVLQLRTSQTKCLQVSPGSYSSFWQKPKNPKKSPTHICSCSFPTSSKISLVAGDCSSFESIPTYKEFGSPGKMRPSGSAWDVRLAMLCDWVFRDVFDSFQQTNRLLEKTGKLRGTGNLLKNSLTRIR